MNTYCLQIPTDAINTNIEKLVESLSKALPEVSYVHALEVIAPDELHGLLTRLGARLVVDHTPDPAPQTPEKKMKRSKAPAPPVQTSGPVELKTCPQCGRSGLLVLTQTGICRVCAMNNARKASAASKAVAEELLDQPKPPAEQVQTSETLIGDPPVQDPAQPQSLLGLAAQGERRIEAQRPRLDRGELEVFTEDRAQSQRFLTRHQQPIRARKLG